MSKEALQGWVEELRQAFREAGPDVIEKSIFGGSAFFVGQSLLGMVELISGQLRTRFREEMRADLQERPHFDSANRLPALLVITEDDRDHARSLVSKAYGIAKRSPAPPPPRPSPASAATPTPRRRRGAQ